jgi:hypothetical protein
MRKLIAVVIAAVVALIVAPALPAEAGKAKVWSFVFDRPDNARHGIDINWTELVMAKRRGKIIVRIQGQEFTRSRLSLVDVWLDVSRSNNGPEFVLSHQFRGDRDGYAGHGTWRVDTWSSVERKVACPKMHTKVKYRSDVIRMSIPKRCVSNPKRVRFSVTTWDITRRDGKWDWFGYYDSAPGRQRLSSPTGRGDF